MSVRAASLVFFAACFAFANAAMVCACPICGMPSVTLAERLASADAAVLVAWVSAAPARGEKPESTTYEIVEAHRGEGFKKGQRLTVEGSHAGKPGSLVFLMANKTTDGSLKWDQPSLDVTETSAQYIVQAPPPETERRKRLEFYVRFLEYPDPTIANDAFAEFVNAPSEDIFAMADRLPREKLRRWLLDEKLSSGRQSGFGLMLGLCGNADDAELLKRRILESRPPRFGIEGLIVGYLLLTGEHGLDTLVQARLKNEETEDGELAAFQNALRYFWTYGNGRIPRPPIEAAMRLFIDNPVLASGAITDLARWKDWSVQPRLVTLYGTPGYEDKQNKEAIVGFLLASTRDVPEKAGEIPPHAREAREVLAKLREKDPKLVAEMERQFGVK